MKYIRGRPSQVQQTGPNNNLIISVEDTRIGKLIDREFEMVVLSIGANGPSSNIPFPVAKDTHDFYIE